MIKLTKLYTSNIRLDHICPKFLSLSVSWRGLTLKPMEDDEAEARLGNVSKIFQQSLSSNQMSPIYGNSLYQVINLLLDIAAVSAR